MSILIDIWLDNTENRTLDYKFPHLFDLYLIFIQALKTVYISLQFFPSTILWGILDLCLGTSYKWVSTVEARLESWDQLY